MRRGRRDPEAPAVGDTLDFWRVEAFEPGRRLRLSAEMKLPGRAWLVVDGQVTQGDLEPESAPLTRHWTSANDCEADVLRLAWLTQQAAELNAQQLTLMVAGCCWLTLPQTDGSVLVSCAPDLPGAQLTASHWKTTLA